MLMMRYALPGMVFLPMLMAFVCRLTGRWSERARDVLLLLTVLGMLALSFVALCAENCTLCLGSFCGYGIRFALDGFRKVYLIVIAFVWLTSTLLSKEYFSHSQNRNRYAFYLLLTLGALTGVFLAADLCTAFVFFEIMSFTSYVWVMHTQTSAAQRAANTYLAVAVIGGLVALMGILLVQWRFGTTELNTLAVLAADCEDKSLLYTAGGCILFGFGAKAGMFPLHIWLPKAHPVAPAPASALLSGLLTKSGIWGVLAISCYLLHGDPAWGWVLVAFGTVTMLYGALLALLSVDLKRTLACSSMSQIGFILIGIGMLCLLGEENALAARGVLLHMVNHSLFKLVLFSCAGVVYQNLHALELNEIRGFGRKKPLLLLAFLMGALGIAGVPGWSGYISKTLLHESIVEGAARCGALLTAVEWMFLFAGGLTIAYMTKLFVALFAEKHPEKQEQYEQMRRYRSKTSALALALPALLPLAFGVTASQSMDAIASLGTDFLRAGELAHAVRYFSLENLKGAGISLILGALLYLLVVRKLLMKDRVYIDRLPKTLDLEERCYRPLLLCILPAALGWAASLLDRRPVGTALEKLLGRGASAVRRVIGALPKAIGRRSKK